jgi:hypothetical protein
MALTLKTDGLASTLALCLAVDDDGTVKEFVSGDVDANMVVDPLVTIDSQSWKGTSRRYFQTAGSGFSPKMISFPSGHRPGVNDNDSGFFMAFAGAPAGNGTASQLVYMPGSGVSIGRDNVSGCWGVFAGTQWRMVSTTQEPTDNATPFSIAVNWAYVTGNPNSNGCALYYGAESGSLALEKISGASGFGNGNNLLQSIGGWAGIATVAAKCHIICAFNTQPSLTDYQALHADWYGTLFDTVATSGTNRLLTMGVG